MSAHHAYLIAFALAVAVIAYEDMSKCHRLPWPPRIIYTGLVFAMLDLLSLLSEELAGVMSVGVVLAIIVNKGFVGECDTILASATQQPLTDADIFLQNPTPQDQSTSGPGNLQPMQNFNYPGALPGPGYQ